MKYFIDTHDKTKGTFPVAELTEEQFLAQFDALEKAAHHLDVFGHAAHVNLHEGKAFCFMSGPDEDAIRKAHAAIDFPFRLHHGGQARDRRRHAAVERSQRDESLSDYSGPSGARGLDLPGYLQGVAATRAIPTPCAGSWRRSGSLPSGRRIRPRSSKAIPRDLVMREHRCA